MAAEQHQGGHDDDPGNAADRRRSERRHDVRYLVGDLTAYQQRRDAGGDLHHRQRHDEGRDPDYREPEGVDETKHRAEQRVPAGSPPSPA